MTEFSSYIAYRKELALKFLIYILICSIGLYISNNYLHSKVLSFTFLLLMVLAALLIKKIIIYSSRKITIKLSNHNIIFVILNRTKKDKDYVERYDISDIESYQIGFPSYLFISLSFNLKSGKRKEFSFLCDNKNENEVDLKTKIETIHSAFKLNKLNIVPTFWASKKGLYTMISFIILLIISIVIVFYFQGNLPVTIFGSLAILMQLLSKRYTERVLYESWKEK